MIEQSRYKAKISWPETQYSWPEIENSWPEIQYSWPEIEDSWPEIIGSWPEIILRLRDIEYPVKNLKSWFGFFWNSILMTFNFSTNFSFQVRIKIDKINLAHSFGIKKKIYFPISQINSNSSVVNGITDNLPILTKPVFCNFFSALIRANETGFLKALE